MSRLDELIQQYCPLGVSFLELSQVADIVRGERITKRDLVEKGEYPVMSGGASYMGRYSKNNRDANTITISSYGTAGYIGFITEDFWANDVCLCVYPHNENVLNKKYLYYSLKSLQEYIYGNTTKAIPDHIPTSFLKELRIPVPPFEVQVEIVRILDNFTELIAKLIAELSARKKQYEYYREKLLYFSNNIPYKTLNELCNISAGGDVPKDSMSKEKTEDNAIPIISNGIGNNALYGFTNKPKITEKAVTVAARGTIGYAEYRDYPYYPIVRLLSVIPKNDKELNTKFLYYCLQGKDYRIPTGGIPQLTAPMLNKETIPVPPIGIQEKIVAILDKFDAICSDVRLGLPAEIEARQKQYEHYRDKLLCFMEKESIN